MPPSAGTPPDSQFGRLALQLGLVTAEQLQDAEALLADIRASGGPVPRLGEVMVEMGVLTPGQVEQVLARQDKTILACAACGARFNVAGLRPRCPRPLQAMRRHPRGPGAPPQPQGVRHGAHRR